MSDLLDCLKQIPRWQKVPLLVLLTLCGWLLHVATQEERAHRQYLQQHCHLIAKKSHMDWKYDVVLQYVKYYEITQRTYACDDGQTLTESTEY